MLSISPDKVCFLIIKAREFDAKMEPEIPDPGDNPTDDADMGLHDRQAAASIRLRARAMPANQPWISALLRGSSDRFPVLSSA